MADLKARLIDKCERLSVGILIGSGAGVSVGIVAGWIYWLICG